MGFGFCKIALGVKDGKRPLLQDIDEAKKLYKERSKQYKQVADIVVEVEGKTPKAIAKEIYKLIYT
jgi:shikimate kinase